MVELPDSNEPELIHHELQSALAQQDSLMSAPESHGLVCALLCFSSAIESVDWMQVVVGDDVIGPCQPLLEQLQRTAQQQLQSDDYAFSLVVPSDDEPLLVRLSALVDWTQGFLFGFGSSVQDADVPDLPEQSREFIEDVREFARLEVEELKESEQDEKAYAELVEYLRVGTLLVWANSPARLLDQDRLP